MTETRISVAEDICKYSTDMLIMNIPAVSHALSALSFRYTENSTLQTDGNSLFISSDFAINKFTSHKNAMTRSILHSLFHCIFRHMFHIGNKNRILWDIACDISAEKAINELDIDCTKTENESEKKRILARIMSEIKNFSTENIYYTLADSNISQEETQKLCDVFFCDDHSLWYEDGMKEIQEDEYSSEGETPSIYTRDDDRPSNGEDTKNKKSSGFNGNTDNNSETWERIARRINAELEYSETQRGTAAGNAIEELNDINREKYDFAHFLRQFSIIHENTEINDEEFDYIYYTYGLKLFEKLPLIEPLETKEAKKIKSFIIAIDTSGSVYGDTVRKFIEKTYSVLKNSDSFFTKTHIRIIQCDSEIRSDTLLTNEKEIEKYLDGLTLHGFGGTDFRPVFSYIDNLIGSGKMQIPDGLIYFTDGDGIFPEKVPKFKTAFVLSDLKADTRKIPSWASKTYIDRM